MEEMTTDQDDPKSHRQSLMDQLEEGTSQFFFDTVSYSHDYPIEEKQSQKQSHKSGQTFQQASIFHWPETLYEEMSAMAEVSFLIYFFGYLINCGRRNANASDSLKQLYLDVHAGNETLEAQKYTPQRLLDIVQENLQHLQATPHFPDDPQHTIDSLKVILERSGNGETVPPTTLVGYNDRNQDEELVYGVGLDHHSKRITVVLRGTEINQGIGVSCNDWRSNLRTTRKPMKIPKGIRKLVENKIRRVKLHQGYQERVFYERDGANTDQERKYDEILKVVKRQSELYPTYKIYVTGHSLGAAMASIIAFLFASEPDLPKPITTINFASPRVGNHKFLRCCIVLEREKQLRFCRVINKHDTVSTFPFFLYCHAGFQVVLRNKHLHVSYPRINDAWWRWLARSMRNSVTARLTIDLLDQHMEYRGRIQKLRHLLEKINLNQLYSDLKMTGFEVDYGETTECRDESGVIIA